MRRGMLDRPYRLFVGGMALFFVGICLPAFVKMLHVVGLFGGAWDGFGLFMVASYLQPWIAASGALAFFVGLFTLHRDSN